MQWAMMVVLCWWMDGSVSVEDAGCVSVDGVAAVQSGDDVIESANVVGDGLDFMSFANCNGMVALLFGADPDIESVQ